MSERVKVTYNNGADAYEASIGGRGALGSTEKEAVECLSWKLLCERTLAEIDPDVREAGEERELIVAWLRAHNDSNADAWADGIEQRKHYEEGWRP